MTKKDRFYQLVKPKVTKALVNVYGLNFSAELTEKQQKLIEEITESIYTIFESSVTIKDLEDKLNEHY